MYEKYLAAGLRTHLDTDLVRGNVERNTLKLVVLVFLVLTFNFMHSVLNISVDCTDPRLNKFIFGFQYNNSLYAFKK